MNKCRKCAFFHKEQLQKFEECHKQATNIHLSTINIRNDLIYVSFNSILLLLN